MIPISLTAHNRQTALNIRSLLADADSYGWSLANLLKEVRKLFTYAQASALASVLLGDALKAVTLVMFKEEQENGR